MKDFYQSVATRVRRFGWASVHCSAFASCPALTHTVGLSEQGGYDFLLVGDDPYLAQITFYRMKECWDQGLITGPGVISGAIQHVDFELIPARPGLIQMKDWERYTGQHWWQMRALEIIISKNDVVWLTSQLSGCEDAKSKHCAYFTPRLTESH